MLVTNTQTKRGATAPLIFLRRYKTMEEQKEQKRIFVIILMNGKKLEYDNDEWIYRIVADDHGAIQYVKVTNRRRENLINYINWADVAHMWVNVNKKIKEYKSRKEVDDNISGPEEFTGSISNDVLNDIRDQLVQDTASGGEEAE